MAEQAPACARQNRLGPGFVILLSAIAVGGGLALYTYAAGKAEPHTGMKPQDLYIAVAIMSALIAAINQRGLITRRWMVAGLVPQLLVAAEITYLYGTGMLMYYEDWIKQGMP